MKVLPTASTSIVLNANCINAIIYKFTNRILVAIAAQLCLVAFAAVQIISAYNRIFVPFELIISGFELKTGPAYAVAISIIFSFIGSIWLFVTVLNIRSCSFVPQTPFYIDNHNFSLVAVFSALLTFSLVIVGGGLIVTKSFWMEPIKKNYGILLKIASIDSDAAEELNRLQMLVQCCGMSTNALLFHGNRSSFNQTNRNSQFWLFPTHLETFEPFATWFDTIHYDSSAAKNLPFSCCRKDTVSPCRHFNLAPIVYPLDNQGTSKMPKFGSSDPTVALGSLNTANSCPDKLFELLKWEFFICCGGSLLATGIVASLVTGALVLAQLRVSEAIDTLLESEKTPSLFGKKMVEMEQNYENVNRATP